MPAYCTRSALVIPDPPVLSIHELVPPRPRSNRASSRTSLMQSPENATAFDTAGHAKAVTAEKPKIRSSSDQPGQKKRKVLVVLSSDEEADSDRDRQVYLSSPESSKASYSTYNPPKKSKLKKSKSKKRPRQTRRVIASYSEDSSSELSDMEDGKVCNTTRAKDAISDETRPSPVEIAESRSNPGTGGETTTTGKKRQTPPPPPSAQGSSDAPKTSGVDRKALQQSTARDGDSPRKRTKIGDPLETAAANPTATPSAGPNATPAATRPRIDPNVADAIRHGVRQVLLRMANNLYPADRDPTSTLSGGAQASPKAVAQRQAGENLAPAPPATPAAPHDPVLTEGRFKALLLAQQFVLLKQQREQSQALQHSILSAVGPSAQPVPATPDRSILNNRVTSLLPTRTRAEGQKTNPPPPGPRSNLSSQPQNSIPLPGPATKVPTKWPAPPASSAQAALQAAVASKSLPGQSTPKAPASTAPTTTASDAARSTVIKFRTSSPGGNPSAPSEKRPAPDTVAPMESGSNLKPPPTNKSAPGQHQPSAPTPLRMSHIAIPAAPRSSSASEPDGSRSSAPETPVPGPAEDPVAKARDRPWDRLIDAVNTFAMASPILPQTPPPPPSVVPAGLAALLHPPPNVQTSPSQRPPLRLPSPPAPTETRSSVDLESFRNRLQRFACRAGAGLAPLKPVPPSADDAPGANGARPSLPRPPSGTRTTLYRKPSFPLYPLSPESSPGPDEIVEST